MRLLIASFNPGKLAELREVVMQYAGAAGLALELVAPGDLGLTEPVAETGTTYAENAVLKARAYAQAAGLPALGDDSGLEVDALDGGPGLYTARYAGPGASDAQRRALLLANLQDVADERRAARFRCAIAVATPAGEFWLTEGAVEGRITRVEAGSGGFGYDPVFFVPQFGCTMAELPAEVKNTISHRARAVAEAIPLLSSLSHR